MKISWTHEALISNKSHINKNGVFAKRAIKKGVRVAVFGGYVVSINDLSKIQKSNKSAYQTILDIGYQVDDDLIFSPVAKTQFSVIEYLNHSCEANCGFVGEINLVTLRNIAKGEEITMDYATCITSKLFNMKCECAAANCRKKVTADDWKRSDLQKKYRGHFQPFIERKIKALTK
ncbi:SET domain-containing protein [Candidatus Parcubacteria bacterium]|uniref:SET domain-containing protein n=1 Tax=Candidatus Kaiserbacteria bacterium CG10_big_fil_rev_8_21_14_0_10_47_16 TaxID=1974608 RepID=A0A2H0UGE7_9BACT|nr:SET domain-containing protein [Candidatus Parcubacteria bacterium]PIR84756.1 MAG: hypothetical protein COU16_01040 [Candidatus Kaiserbacteria bacterium CG10_big_fil_rev_8_21_14_0_10_47_16]